MATQAHETDKLVKVGLEGFALLDEFYGRQKKSGMVPTTQANDRYQIHHHHHHHHHHYYNDNNKKQCVYGGSQVITVSEPVIDSNQAAQFYGGIVIVDRRLKKAS